MQYLSCITHSFDLALHLEGLLDVHQKYQKTLQMLRKTETDGPSVSSWRKRVMDIRASST